jgi:hypothetical protein
MQAARYVASDLIVLDASDMLPDAFAVRVHVSTRKVK